MFDFTTTIKIPYDELVRRANELAAIGDGTIIDDETGEVLMSVSGGLINCLDRDLLNEMLKSARFVGHDDGYSDGYDDGFDAGKRDEALAHAEDLDDAYETGRADGYHDGYKEGHDVGFREGFEQ